MGHERKEAAVQIVQASAFPLPEKEGAGALRVSLRCVLCQCLLRKRQLFVTSTKNNPFQRAGSARLQNRVAGNLWDHARDPVKTMSSC